MKDARLISFPAKGQPEEGYLHILANDHFPFEIKRVFYTTDTPSGITRGRHAHYETEMVLIALCGVIDVKTITVDGLEKNFTLTNASEGLFLPKLCWHEMTYSNGAIQLVVCSTLYDETDYIRDWDEYKSVLATHGGA
jgi:WxcM-like, C-terminal